MRGEDGLEKIAVLAVVGPTASGKTGLGVELAKRLDGEVVSCDSMQIYQTMDVATAKPTEEEMQGVPHHLIDFLPPDTPFSLAEYLTLAEKTIAGIHARGRLPVIVGGTGLYVDTLLQGVQLCDQGDDPAFRAEMAALAEKEGGGVLMERLRRCDPDYAEKVHENNIPRLIRALEVYHTTGLPMSIHIARSRDGESRYAPFWLGLRYHDRGVLYDRINRRVDLMLEQGLLDEARAAYAARMSTAAQAIGCKELYPYLAGEKPLDECVEKLKQSTRRYAKRQLTWFKRNEAIHWLEPDTMEPGTLVETAVELVRQSGLLAK
jgi:tRNA dimethylallyltransferase